MSPCDVIRWVSHDWRELLLNIHYLKLDIMVVPNHTGQQSMFKGHIYDGRKFQYICDQV